MELSPEERREALFEGHRRNPLTTTLQGGRFLSAFMLPLFGLLPPAGYGVITTTGRRTGRRRRKCVRAMRQGDKVFLVAIPGPEAGWLMNIEADPRVRLRIRGGNFAGVARVLVDDEERRQAREEFCGKVVISDYGAFLLHRPGRPTADRIKDLLETWFRYGTPLVVDLSHTADG
jgi:deazaflavin-dependent oxidoreductase (nitroreductase family)